MEKQNQRILFDEMELFKQCSHPVRVKNGQMIFSVGDTADSVYLLESGHVKLYHSTAAGKLFLLSIRKNNDLFGIPAILLGEKRCTFAMALGSCKLWCMGKTVFLDLLHQNARFALMITLINSRYLRETEVIVGQLMSMDADQRVAWLLVYLTTGVAGAKEEKVQIPIKLTHQEMANMVGTCRQTVTSILNRFKKDGVINIERNSIDIIDYNRLNRYVV